MRISSAYESDKAPELAKVLSKDESRPVLTCGYLDTERARLEGTDSYCLASIPVDVGETDTSGLIPATAIVALHKAARAWRGSVEDGPELVCGTETVELVTADGRQSWPRPGGQFPNVAQLVPANLSQFRIGINPKLLANVAAALGSPEKVTVTFTLTSDASEGDGAGYYPSALRPFIVTNGGHGETGLVMPIRIGG